MSTTSQPFIVSFYNNSSKLESLAGKKPVIVVNAWGPPEIITQGETRLLVVPGDPTPFAPAIIELLSSSATVREMGDRANMVVKTSLSIERAANDMVRLWLDHLDT